MSLQMFAQVYSTADWGSFKLRGDEKFGVMFDYKGGEYNGYPYKEFIDEFPDFLTEVKEVESRFIAEINDCFSDSSKERLSRLRFTTKLDNKEYILLVRIGQVDKHGDTGVNAYIVDKNGIVASLKNVWGDGGRFGSFSNLMGDGMENVARNIYKSFRLAIYKKAI